MKDLLADPNQILFELSATITIGFVTFFVTSVLGMWIFTLYKSSMRLKASNTKIRQQATFDSLTDLYNRHKFYEILSEEIDHAKYHGERFALLFLDLDEFKEVNDTLGHSMGDALLREVANRLKNRVRSSDAVSRIGGDEFTIIIRDVKNSESLKSIAENICSAISSEFMIQGHSLNISTSLGITCFPRDADTDEEMLINADQAMYASKNKGRNCYTFFSNSMRKARVERSQILKDLRVALENDQMELFYQPIIDFKTGKLIKAEALLRWHHPSKGLVFPKSFIGLAEESGVINEIGEWSFKQVALKAAKWRKEYSPNLQISLNTSPIQYRENGINVETWGDYLTDCEIDGSAIIVEITEGLLMDSSYAVKEKLLAIRNKGIEVAIDDFGTGYSSLSYMKKFDIDYLKIDQSFISALARDSEDMALCEAIIVMAHKLSCKVIAEGVETINQHQLLRNAGCDAGQGHLFKKAVPADEFEKLLKKEQSGQITYLDSYTKPYVEMIQRDNLSTSQLV